MKRPRISVRFLLLLVAAMAVALAVDQSLETKMRALSETIANDPASVIGDQPDVAGFKQIQVNLKCLNLTTLTDRLAFRRKLSVTFDEFKYLEIPAGVSGLVLAERQMNLLITPISTSND